MERPTESTRLKNTTGMYFLEALVFFISTPGAPMMRRAGIFYSTPLAPLAPLPPMVATRPDQITIRALVFFNTADLAHWGDSAGIF